MRATRARTARRIIQREEETNASVGIFGWNFRSRFWTAESNDEFVRMFVGSLVALLNMVIVMQDWDFPNFAAG